MSWEDGHQISPVHQGTESRTDATVEWLCPQFTPSSLPALGFVLFSDSNYWQYRVGSEEDLGHGASCHTVKGILISMCSTWIN